MALTIDDIGIGIKNKIRDSAAIKAYCNANLGGPHSVYYAAREGKSPPQDDYPLFNIIPLGKSRGEDGDVREYSVRIEVVIVDATSTSQTVATVKEVSYNGATKIEALLDLAFDAIDGSALSSQLFYVGKDFELSPTANFPIWAGALDLSIQILVLIGGAEPTIDSPSDSPSPSPSDSPS